MCILFFFCETLRDRREGEGEKMMKKKSNITICLIKHTGGWWMCVMSEN